MSDDLQERRVEIAGAEFAWLDRGDQVLRRLCDAGKVDGALHIGRGLRGMWLVPYQRYVDWRATRRTARGRPPGAKANR